MLRESSAVHGPRCAIHGRVGALDIFVARIPMAVPLLQLLASLVARLPDPGRTRFWCLVALVVKAAYFAISLQQGYAHKLPASIAICTGDCDRYVLPIDHLLAHGRYEPDFRMPGYGAAYALFRAWLPQGTAMNGLALLQLVLDAVATVLLARSLWRITGSIAAHHLAFALYGLSSTISGFNPFILTESLCASVMVLTLHFLLAYLGERRLRDGMLTGMLATWAYFMRPILLPLLLLVLVLLVRAAWRSPAGRWRALACLLPFLLAQGAWTLRNHAVHDRWFLMTRTKYYPGYSPGQMASWALVGTFADITARYFLPDVGWPNRQAPTLTFDDLPIPPEILTPEVSMDSLVELRTYGMVIEDPHADPDLRRRCDSLLKAKAERYTASIHRHHPFIVHVRTPARLAARHIFRSSGVYNLFLRPFGQLPSWAKALKLSHMAVYLVALYGALGLLVLAVLRRERLHLLLAGALAYGMLVHPVIIGIGDVRYLYAFHPVLVLGAVLFYTALARHLGLNPPAPRRTGPPAPASNGPSQR